MTAHESDTPAQPHTAPRFLIIRVSAIGDVLMASPVAQLLREAYPHAHIAWVVEPLAAPLVRANPYVDEVILFEHKSRWRQLLHSGQLAAFVREVRTFVGTLRAGHFDVALDCQGLLKSALVTRASGASRRIGPGFASEPIAPFMTEIAPAPLSTTYLAEKYLSLLTPLGITPTPHRPVLTVPPEDAATARTFLETEGLGTHRYAVCCLASTRKWKDWVWPRWGELADRLWANEGLRTVFIGGPERREDAAHLAAVTSSAPISAVGRTSLLQSAALVQQAAVVIGVDTGLTYAGLTTLTPTIALYGSTDPGWLRDEPRTTVCYHRRDCSPCRRRPTCIAFDCMQDITVDEVCQATHAALTDTCSPR